MGTPGATCDMDFLVSTSGVPYLIVRRSLVIKYYLYRSAICFVFTFLVVFWNLNSAALTSPAIEPLAAEAADLVTKYVSFTTVTVVLAIGAIYLFLMIRTLRFW
jgi:hypothetical protein